MHFTNHHLLTVDSSFELSLIDWENKETLNRAHLTVSDPKFLTPVNIHFHVEYNPLPSAFQELKHVWVLMNYTLAKSVGGGSKIKESEPAGYSIHCFDKDLMEVYTAFLPSHESAISFEKCDRAQFKIAESTRIKTVEIRGENDIKIVKQMKVVTQII